MHDYTFLQVVWFVLISILWLGYFVLEGFDFGVGMLIRAVGRNDAEERRAVMHTIGPVWDGNEVWLLVAGGATFAAFPQWYATLFSGFYLALFLILVGLIVRNVSFEFWGKGETDALAAALGVGDDRSAAPCPPCSGASAGPTSSTACRSTRSMEYTGTLFDLLHPYALLGGLATLLDLPRPRRDLPQPEDRGGDGRAGEGDRRPRWRRSPPWSASPSWSGPCSPTGGGVDVASAIVAAVAALRAGRRRAARRAQPGARLRRHRRARSSPSSSALFVDLFPHTMVSSTSSAFDMTLNAVVLLALHAGRDDGGRGRCWCRSCSPTRPGPTGSSATGSRPRTSARSATRSTCSTRRKREGDGGEPEPAGPGR